MVRKRTKEHHKTNTNMPSLRFERRYGKPMACLLANASRVKRIENESRAKKKSLPVKSTHYNPKDAE
jgi:hypothetical protein